MLTFDRESFSAQDLKTWIQDLNYNNLINAKECLKSVIYTAEGNSYRGSFEQLRPSIIFLFELFQRSFGRNLVVIKTILETLCKNYLNHPKYKSRVSQRLDVTLDFADSLYDILLDLINKFLKAIV